MLRERLAWQRTPGFIEGTQPPDTPEASQALTVRPSDIQIIPSSPTRLSPSTTRHVAKQSLEQIKQIEADDEDESQDDKNKDNDSDENKEESEESEDDE